MVATGKVRVLITSIAEVISRLFIVLLSRCVSVISAKITQITAIQCLVLNFPLKQSLFFYHLMVLIGVTWHFLSPC